jgi:hypothetical protein
VNIQKEGATSEHPFPFKEGGGGDGRESTDLGASGFYTKLPTTVTNHCMHGGGGGGRYLDLIRQHTVQ